VSPDCEKYLWDRLHLAGEEGPAPRDVIAEMFERKMIESPKQAWATLNKWAAKGLYEYGVNVDLGWKVKD
jgi:hypothetical protein